MTHNLYTLNAPTIILLTQSVDILCRLHESMESPPGLGQIMGVRMWASGDS